MHIVIGAHRSGTSLIAGLLHYSGIIMGSEFTFTPEPNEENPLGFFEDVRFRNINDKALKFVGYDVKSWKVDVPTCKANKTLTRQITSLLDKPIMGFKDPRMCLTWPVWEPHLQKNTTFIYVYRNPLAVAQSLYKRGNTNSIEHGLKLWQVYNTRALPVRKKFKTIFVNYETILETGQIEQLKIKDINNIIDQNLSHYDGFAVPEMCQEQWNTLVSLQ